MAPGTAAEPSSVRPNAEPLLLPKTKVTRRAGLEAACGPVQHRQQAPPPELSPEPPTPSATADTPTLSAASPVPLQGTVGCNSGWSVFWAIVLLTTVCYIMGCLVFPDIAIAAVSGGTDPCSGPGSGTPQCNAALQNLSRISAIFGACAAGLNLLGGPLAGSMVDILGSTRPVIATSMLLGLLGSVALAGVAIADISIYWSFGAQELLTLLPAKTVFTCWIMERTRPSERFAVFARLGAALALEGIGVCLAAQLSSKRHVTIAMCIIQFVVLFLCFFLPDTGIDSSRRFLPARVREDELSCCSNLRYAAFLARLLRHQDSRQVLTLSMLTGTIDTGSASIFFLYFKQCFGIDFKGLASVVAVATGCKMAVQFCFAAPLQKCLGAKWLTMLCFVIGIIGQIGFLLAPSMTWVYPTLAFTALSSIAAPAVSALVINIATEREGQTGATVGLLSAADSIPALVGPLLYRYTFFFFLAPDGPQSFPGAPWVLDCLLKFICFLQILWIPKRVFESAEPESTDIPDAPAAPGAMAPGTVVPIMGSVES